MTDHTPDPLDDLPPLDADLEAQLQHLSAEDSASLLDQLLRYDTDVDASQQVMLKEAEQAAALDVLEGVDVDALQRDLHAELADFDSAAAERELQTLAAFEPYQGLPQLSRDEHQTLMVQLLNGEIDQAEFNRRVGIDPDAPGEWHKVD